MPQPFCLAGVSHGCASPPAVLPHGRPGSGQAQKETRSRIGRREPLHPPANRGNGANAVRARSRARRRTNSHLPQCVRACERAKENRPEFRAAAGRTTPGATGRTQSAHAACAKENKQSSPNASARFRARRKTARNISGNGWQGPEDGQTRSARFRARRKTARHFRAAADRTTPGQRGERSPRTLRARRKTNTFSISPIKQSARERAKENRPEHFGQRPAGTRGWGKTRSARFCARRKTARSFSPGQRRQTVKDNSQKELPDNSNAAERLPAQSYRV